MWGGGYHGVECVGGGGGGGVACTCVCVFVTVLNSCVQGTQWCQYIHAAVSSVDSVTGHV